MGKHIINLALTLIVTFSISTSSFAQDADADLDGLVSETKNDLLVVVGAGLAGAILGLSTLSFVEEPKEHTQNIIMGASLGIIAGVAYVAVSQATKSQDLLVPPPVEDEEEFSSMGTKSRRRWHYGHVSENQKLISYINQVQLNFRF